MTASESEKQRILPWDNSELEKMLRELIAHGTELLKTDFKLEIELNTPEQKAELLKDISAIANTYDGENHEDHGLLIYGVKPKSIEGVTSTESDTDKLQNTIEQLLKTYIAPMPQVYILGFEEKGKKWGVIVIPPRNNKPYMFAKDLQCTDRRKARRRGEWFVRRGSTTDPGLPEDLTMIIQKQTEMLLEPLRESIRGLQSRVVRVEDQYNSALFKLVAKALSKLSGTNDGMSAIDADLETDVSETLGADLSDRLKRRLHTPKDALTEDLIADAKKLREFLDAESSDIPWNPQLNNIEENKRIIEELEARTRPLQESMATIVLKDEEGRYTDALLRALRVLAKVTEIPSGTSYNDIGKSLRYYPIGILIYTIFVCGVAANRSDILKRVLEIPLKHRTPNRTSALIDVLRYWHYTGALIRDGYAQKWCAPMAQRIRQITADNIGEMMPELTEPEYFFQGEFVLSLMGIDQDMTEGEPAEGRTPLHGLYLYMSEAHDAVEGFLREPRNWFRDLYDHPINEILDAFDANAMKVIPSDCLAMGFRGLKLAQVYQESVKKIS